MRRLILAAGLALAFMVVGAPSCQPAEPAMTITVYKQASCDWVEIEGAVTPPAATTKIVIQRTVNGKWVDFTWYESYLELEQAHVLSVKPGTNGGWAIDFPTVHGGKKLTGTIHLRVRSNGGYIGPSWYTTIPTDCS